MRRACWTLTACALVGGCAGSIGPDDMSAEVVASFLLAVDERRWEEAASSFHEDWLEQYRHTVLYGMRRIDQDGRPIPGAPIDPDGPFPLSEPSAETIDPTEFMARSLEAGDFRTSAYAQVLERVPDGECYERVVAEGMEILTREVAGAVQTDSKTAYVVYREIRTGPDRLIMGVTELVKAVALRKTAGGWRLWGARAEQFWIPGSVIIDPPDGCVLPRSGTDSS